MRKRTYDALVLGGGVVGSSTAFHLAKLGASVALVDKAPQPAAGATGRSSACFRLHYSVPENSALARHSQHFFHNFKENLRSKDADSGYVQCGHLLVGGNDVAGQTMQKRVTELNGKGFNTRMISLEEARELHPYVNLDDAVHVGWEPTSGFADPYLTTTSLLNSAKTEMKGSLDLFLDTDVRGLIADTSKVMGVQTEQHGDIEAGVTISCLNIWTQETLGHWLGLKLPVSVEKHHLIAVRNPSQPYMMNRDGVKSILPNVKCLLQESQPYFRAYDGGSSLLVGDNNPLHVEQVASAENWDETVDMDEQMHCAELAAHRFAGYQSAQIFSSWSGCYDASPDWNPILGSLPGIDRLRVGFGFSGHGFKLSPVVGEMLAADALGETAVNIDGVTIDRYSVERFDEGSDKPLLTGVYHGAAS